MAVTSENSKPEPNIKLLKSALGYTCIREEEVSLSEIDFNGYAGDMMIRGLEDDAAFQYTIKCSEHWSLRHNGELLCVLGAYPLWPGLWEAFLLPTVKIRNHPMAAYRVVRGTMETACIERGVRRLQTTVDVTRQKGLAFAMKLGFKVEATLEKFGPEGEDHLLLSKIFKE